jgi:hypothetical protein
MWRRKTGPESLIFIVPTMTPPRQQRKAFAFALVWAALLGMGLGIVLAASVVGEAAAQVQEERIVVNPNSGLGLSGFDPVAYFTDQKPVIGKPELEYTLGRAVWRFANAGNRAAFIENPDVYIPRFGGYDPVAIARGTSVPGHPLFWAVAADRLYVFYSEAARAAFAIDPGRTIATAERKWPEVALAIGQ